MVLLDLTIHLSLQCFTDFSNLDGYATGTAGPDTAKGLADLAVSEKLTTTDLGELISVP